jgi:glutathione S-transferase
MVASDKPTIADLSAYEELIQLRFTDFDYSKYENVMAWVKRMEQIPEVAEENKLFDKFLNAFKSKGKPKL